MLFQQVTADSRPLLAALFKTYLTYAQPTHILFFMRKNPLFNTSPQQASLTPKQKLILDFILKSTEKNGYAPSQNEIAEHFGFSSLGTVQNYLVRLQRQGVLSKTWNGKRTLQALTPPPNEEGLELPLLGRVAAGKPIEAITVGETIEIPPMMKTGGDLFALKVQGQSMIEDGILDGDYVVIRKQATAVNGQTVVATLNNEATIKRFYKKNPQIELHPANSQMKPIIVSESEKSQFRIEGVLVGVIRQYK